MGMQLESKLNFAKYVPKKILGTRKKNLWNYKQYVAEINFFLE